nr:immunoglobulin heavy chain junction region [Macaca mulatta]MOW77362.1 immunoglobulin heavy chain junction region [Macaca mulatta]MOW77441.1 immunoglobulin heavy chain junction region [Macaca mulatta]MOW77762.1 immunoglobulin heavy chain junction region [Macaca mulatta]MOW79950.1 immunoglobulin heavy chain junction region [Macaca mulatta]
CARADYGNSLDFW